jgi:adenylate kinase family enzyme
VTPYYEARGLLTRIDGMQSIDAVAAEITKVVGKISR